MLMEKQFKVLILCVIMTSGINLFAQNVYVNKTDSKFHLLTCKYLDPSHDSLDMMFAVKKGLGPCPVCNPSAKGASSSGSMGATKSMDATKSMNNPGMNQQVNSKATIAVQKCAVIDKDGKRCIGDAEPGSLYCWEHRNYKK